MNKPTIEYLRGIIDTIVDEYHENIERKNIRPMVSEKGEMNFEIRLAFDISEDEQDFEYIEINPDEKIQGIKDKVFRCMDSIRPYYD